MHPGVKIGRTDPAKDPKGALTVEFLKKADKPELAKLVLDHSSVLPEETLVQKIQAGELDVGFFYSVETTDAGLTAIELPAAITPKAIYTLRIATKTCESVRSCVESRQPSVIKPNRSS